MKPVDLDPALHQVRDRVFQRALGDRDPAGTRRAAAHDGGRTEEAIDQPLRPVVGAGGPQGIGDLGGPRPQGPAETGAGQHRRRVAARVFRLQMDLVRPRGRIAHPRDEEGPIHGEAGTEPKEPPAVADEVGDAEGGKQILYDWNAPPQRLAPFPQPCHELRGLREVKGAHIPIGHLHLAVTTPLASAERDLPVA
jgi:hypothetical protein